MAAAPFAFRRVRDFLHEEYDRAFRHDHWNVGMVDAPIRAFLEPDFDPEVRWFPPPPPGKYYADPFGRAVGNATYVFFEAFDFRTDKGSIAYVRAHPDGSVSEPRIAIDLPHHASYPFLVEREGSAYCIPETAAAHEIALYRAVEFPDRWEKAATLVPGFAGSDNTLLEHDGLLWLFCTDFDDGAFSKLRLWYARDLLGPWRPHAANPVKTDPQSARPAGTPFVVDGEVFRPAQDSSATYGGRVVVNRIIRLTPTEFREEPAATIGPFRSGPYAHGLHTLSALGDRTLVDGKWIAFNRFEMTRHMRESLEDRWPRILVRR